MHVDDDTGKTIGPHGQTTIQERKATFHTTCVAQKFLGLSPLYKLNLASPSESTTITTTTRQANKR